MGVISEMAAKKKKRTLGLDVSTRSLAFSIFEGSDLHKYGKIEFDGNTAFERLYDSRRKMEALDEELVVDYVCIEKAVMVRGTGTAIKMGMAVGTIISTLWQPGVSVVEVTPIQWQSFIGNKNFTRAEKLAYKKKHPGKSVSWVREALRAERKQFTMDYFNEMFGLDVEDDDVSDAIGVGWYGVNHTV